MTWLNEVVTLVHSFVHFGGLQSDFKFWCPPVPEIDGPAGISALALLVTAGIISYNRARS
jgi:hypothetical protein